MNVGLMTPAELAIEDTLRELRKLDNAGVTTRDMLGQLEGIAERLRERITAKRMGNEPSLFGEAFATVNVQVNGTALGAALDTH